MSRPVRRLRKNTYEPCVCRLQRTTLRAALGRDSELERSWRGTVSSRNHRLCFPRCKEPRLGSTRHTMHPRPVTTIVIRVELTTNSMLVSADFFQSRRVVTNVPRDKTLERNKETESSRERFRCIINRLHSTVLSEGTSYLNLTIRTFSFYNLLIIIMNVYIWRCMMRCIIV